MATTKLSKTKRRLQFKADDILPVVGDGTNWAATLEDVAQFVGPYVPVSEDLKEAAQVATDAADRADQSAANAAASTAAIGDASSEDAGELSGNEIMPASRGSGLLQTPLNKIAKFGLEKYAGYTPTENPSFAIIVNKALDETVDLRTKFGLTGDIDDEQVGPFNDLIEYINSLGSFGGTARVHGCYRINGALQNLKNGLCLKGDGFSRSRLFFDGVTGLVFDLAGQIGTPGYPILEDIALTTNGTFASGFAAVRVLPWSTVPNVDPGMTRTFQSTRVLTCSEAIWNAVPQSNLDPAEWATHYKLGETGSVINLNDCHIDHCLLGGSYLNMSPTTQTGAIGIDGGDVTGLRITIPKMYALSTGTILRGQSEGAIMYGGTHVNVGDGFVTKPGTALPANNHTINGTHFKVHFRGVQMQDADPSATGGPQGAQSQFTDVYVLEKTTSAPKPRGFIGFEIYGRGVTLTACKVWTTNLASNVDVSQSSKTGYLVGRNNVQLLGCFCDGMHYALNVANYNNAAYNTGAAHIDDFNEQHTAISFLAPGSLRPKGTVSGSVTNGDANQSEYIDAEYKYKYSDGTKWLMSRYDGWNIYTGATYSYNHKTSSAATNFDSRVVFSGGDTTSNVDNMGVVNFLVNKFWSSATEIGPSTDNVATLGWPTRRCSVGYFGSPPVVTSDFNEKEQISDPDEVEKRVAARLKGMIRTFKFKSSVDAKGDNDARWHFGVIAQEVKAAFEAEGLVAENYALFCCDEWGEQAEVRDEDGAVIQEYQAAGSRYGIRYEELIAFIISAL